MDSVNSLIVINPPNAAFITTPRCVDNLEDASPANKYSTTKIKKNLLPSSKKIFDRKYSQPILPSAQSI